jgi:DNA-binding transcriptional ArsR family regulator
MARAARRPAETRRSDSRGVPEAHEAKVFKALGDPTRYQIVRTLLAEGEVACSRLVEMFPLSPPALSHHFRVLEECGLLEVRKEGVYHFFRIDAERLEQAVGSLGIPRGTRRR